MAPTCCGPLGPSSGSRTTPSTHTAVQTEAHIATAQHNFNYVFLLMISTMTVTLARFRRMLPDDGPNGPKNVGTI
jgi:hypothetical protein